MTLRLRLRPCCMALLWPLVGWCAPAPATLAPTTGPSATAAPALQLSDLQKIIALREAKISPDGKFIAVILATPNPKTDKSDSEIDRVDVQTGTRRALTWKRTGLSSPK